MWLSLSAEKLVKSTNTLKALGSTCRLWHQCIMVSYLWHKKSKQALFAWHVSFENHGLDPRGTEIRTFYSPPKAKTPTAPFIWLPKLHTEIVCKPSSANKLHTGSSHLHCAYLFILTPVCSTQITFTTIKVFKGCLHLTNKIDSEMESRIQCVCMSVCTDTAVE